MKFLALLLTAIITLSCTTMKKECLCRTEQEISGDTPVYIADIRLEPAHRLENISAIVRDVIKSCLLEQGFNISESKDNDALALSVLILSSNYLYNYEAYESITLSLTLTKKDSTAINCLYTCDSDKSLDSFALILSIIQEGIGRFAGEVFNEK